MKIENSVLKVEGGRRMKGEIVPQGAKNEALQILCAVLLTEEKVTIHNIPNITDVNRLIDILTILGTKINKLNQNSYEFIAKDLKIDILDTPAFLRKVPTLRGSIMLVGVLLSRFGRIKILSPGGDKIGRRRLDTHFLAIEKLGGTFSFDSKKKVYEVSSKALKGTYILLNEPSVTGTANVIMASVKAKGKTTLYNAACEPYIQQLCHMLNRMGASIKGIGSNLLTIEGTSHLSGTTHTLLPDIIEIGSFIGLAAMTSSEIVIKTVKTQSFGLILRVFEKIGIEIVEKGTDIIIPYQDRYQIKSFIDGSIFTVSDGPWPSFTSDLISVILVVATQAKGIILIHQKMFESRLFFVDRLIDMGAKIILCDPHRAHVIGLNKEIPLRAISMTSPDIRAGIALLIAALSAEGTSYIHNAEQIDRGYQQIDTRLNALGANIQRI